MRRLLAIHRFLRQDRLTTLEQIERMPVDLHPLITRAVAEVQRQSKGILGEGSTFGVRLPGKASDWRPDGEFLMG